MSLVDLVRGLKDRKDAAVESYAAAVARVADDGKIPLENLERLLESAGKTADDFQRDVERLKLRMEAAERLRHVPDSTGQRKAAEKRRAQAQAQLDAAEAEFDGVIHEIQVELDTLVAQERLLQQSKNYLEETADPNLIAQVRQAERQHQQAINALIKASENVDAEKREVRFATEGLENVRAGKVDLVKRNGYIGPETTEAKAEKWLAACKARLDQAEATLKAAHEAKALAERRAVESRALLLIP